MKLLKRYKNVIFVIIGVLLALIVFLYFQSYLQIKNLPEMNIKQAKIHVLKKKEIYSTEFSKCTDWHDVLYAWCIKSPYFPYKRLEIKEIENGLTQYKYENGKGTNLSTESKYLLKDNFWNVYWVQTQKSSNLTLTYGPYKTP